MSETMTRKQKFYFVVGETVCMQVSYNVLDAWFKVENTNVPLGSEFTQSENRTIDAYTSAGTLIATRSWSGWHNALMTDTYGNDWKKSVERAESLIR